jgi:hypothetical protein
MTDDPEAPRRPRGRPRIDKAKRSFFNARLRAPLKQYLEAMAARNGRSLSEEIEYRLERSVNTDLAVENLRQNILPSLSASRPHPELSPTEQLQHTFGTIGAAILALAEATVGNVVSARQMIEEAGLFKEVFSEPRTDEKKDG